MMAESVCDYILQRAFSQYVSSKQFSQTALEDAWVALLIKDDDVDRADEIVKETRERLGNDTTTLSRNLSGNPNYQNAAELVEKLTLPYKTVKERLEVARSLYRTVLIEWGVPPDLAGLESMLKEALEE